MRTTDAGKRPLVAQQRVELSSLTAKDLPERRRTETKSVRPEVRELRGKRVRCEEPDTRASLLAGLGQHELSAVREREAEHGRLGCLRSRGVIAQSTRAHQMNAEDERSVRRGKEKVLAAAPRAREPVADEPRERRVERLHGRDVRGADARDCRPRDERIELPHPGFDFR